MAPESRSECARGSVRISNEAVQSPPQRAKSWLLEKGNGEAGMLEATMPHSCLVRICLSCKISSHQRSSIPIRERLQQNLRDEYKGGGSSLSLFPFRNAMCVSFQNRKIEMAGQMEKRKEEGKDTIKSISVTPTFQLFFVEENG